MVTAFSISLIFSSTVPFVTICGALFFAMRHLIDCHNLLTYYRKEIDSSGKLITNITNSAVVITILY